MFNTARLTLKSTTSMTTGSIDVDTKSSISDLFRIPERYLRSIHLERDFDDTSALRHYVVTPPMAAVFSRIVQGAEPGSGRRAWRITGDYGTGKSSFALMLAQVMGGEISVLEEPINTTLREMYQQILQSSTMPLVPVLVTGSREAIGPAIAQGLTRALQRVEINPQHQSALDAVFKRAEEVRATNDVGQLLDLLDEFKRLVSRNGRGGVLLILDELGKFLEYASLHPEQEDVYVLQRLAEMAARSGKVPFILLGLLHQGFHAYAERLPSTARQEWEKVAGRYEEIIFDQPLLHIAALVAAALNVEATQLPNDVVAVSPAVVQATQRTHWYGASLSDLSPLSLYPLHPTVIPVLARFFAQFGQHERSLFSFLLSSEPFGLQDFAAQPIGAHAWYRLPDFYDYIRSVFGYRLGGISYRSQWLRISETVDRAADLGIDDIELRVLKVIALLNVLDAEHLLATPDVISAALSEGALDEQVRNAVNLLQRRGLLFHRGAGNYCLWPSTSVNLESAFNAARRSLGTLEYVAPHLTPYLEATPIVARRHYLETGTFRYFTLHYTSTSTLEETLAQRTEADGRIVVILCESLDEHKAACQLAASHPMAQNPSILIAVPPPLQHLAPELQDAQCWEWVAEHTQELSQDTYAAVEVARQVATARRNLQQKIAVSLGIRGTQSTAQWWHNGKPLSSVTSHKIATIISAICDDVYAKAPLIRNELLNRRALSGAAASARFRLIQKMFTSADQPSLGIAMDKAPPEKSMYLSVLHTGNVHRREDNRYTLAIPPAAADPLRLRPVLSHLLDHLEQEDRVRVPVLHLINLLQSPPYGIRQGVIFLLFAILLNAYAHRIAVYEHGTFLQRFGASDFMRLMKQPGTFELQYSSIEGVRAEVFAALADVFANELSSTREPVLLDVVRSLMKFAAQLPDYTRNHTHLSEVAIRVRDALISAREPSTLLFVTLPEACGIPPFTSSTSGNSNLIHQFVKVLREALTDLRNNYPYLLERIRQQVNDGFEGTLDRATIAKRAEGVILAARDLRVQTFARCLADTALSDDAWAVRIGSFVVSKPPTRWTVTDERRAVDEIDALLGTFKRVEAVAFSDSHQAPDSSAIRLMVTQADGREGYLIVRTTFEQEEDVEEMVKKLEVVLAENNAVRLSALAQLLRMSIVFPESAN